MTLIVSMRGKYGAAILADSQETVRDRDGNEFKYAVLKNTPEKMKGFHFVIAGGGDGNAIDELTEQFRRALKRSDCRTLACFRELLEKHLTRELKSLQKHDPGARIELVVAATKNGKWEMWRNARKTLVPTVDGPPTLVGFATELYQHVGGALLPHATNTLQVILVGLRILELARQSSTCVDAPHHGVLVVPGGMFVLPDKVLAELTLSIATFGADIERLLLASADTTLRKQDFIRILDEFKDNALHLRNEYQQSVAEKDFLAEFSGAPSGISVFPTGSVRTASVGTVGITVKVEEHDGLPMQSASQTSEPEK
jgi:hypothetical protein